MSWRQWHDAPTWRLQPCLGAGPAYPAFTCGGASCFTRPVPWLHGAGDVRGELPGGLHGDARALEAQQHLLQLCRFHHAAVLLCGGIRLSPDLPAGLGKRRQGQRLSPNLAAKLEAHPDGRDHLRGAVGSHCPDPLAPPVSGPVRGGGVTRGFVSDAGAYRRDRAVDHAGDRSAARGSAALCGRVGRAASGTLALVLLRLGQHGRRH